MEMPVSSKGLTWHSECFTCATCGAALLGAAATGGAAGRGCVCVCVCLCVCLCVVWCVFEEERNCCWWIMASQVCVPLCFGLALTCPPPPLVPLGTGYYLVDGRPYDEACYRAQQNFERCTICNEQITSGSQLSTGGPSGERARASACLVA